MMRWAFLIILLVSLLVQISQSQAQAQKFHYSSNKMGSPMNLVFVDQDSLHAKKIAQAAFELVDSLVSLYSDYDSTSELSRLSQQSGMGPIKVSPGLMSILLLGQSAYQYSHQSFDISIGPLSQLWRKARKTHQFPDSSAVSLAKNLVGLNKMVIDKKTSSVNLLVKGMRLDLGGIAKGFVAQEVLQRLKDQGISAALVDAGGDIAMSNPPLQAKGWLIGVNVPEAEEALLDSKLLLKNCAVATSGDVYQFFLHNGRKYAHITDPRTGYGVTFQRNVTVIAADAATADWLATACSILPIQEALQLAEKQQAFVLITLLENNRVISHKSKGFDRFWKKD
jgi:thiamine biosynthesis lipoprotein